MKRRLLAFFLSLLLSITAAACSKNSTAKSPTKEDVIPTDKGSSSQSGNTEKTSKETNLENRVLEVMTALKNNDTEKLSQLAHPEKGVRFSPYTFINKDTDLVFKANNLKNLKNDPAKFTWGQFDGSGEPIKMTYAEYYKSFIYDKDFIAAKEISYNKPISGDTMTNNTFEFYKNSTIVEYHFPGFDPKFEGLDWESLKLVLEKYNGSWYLVGIVHSQWTI